MGDWKMRQGENLLVAIVALKEILHRSFLKACGDAVEGRSDYRMSRMYATYVVAVVA